MYNTGSTVLDLIQRFHLSEDSIRKIIVKTRDLLQNVAK
jgi:Mor family transcriptional regulator